MAKRQLEQTAHSRRSIRTDSEKYRSEKGRRKTKIYLHVLISQKGEIYYSNLFR